MRRSRLRRRWLAAQQAKAQTGESSSESNQAQARQPDTQPMAHGTPPTVPPVVDRDHESRILVPTLGTTPKERPGLELKGILELLGAVAAPVTVVTSVLFYFGWAYTRAFYDYFAIHYTVLDLSVRDYVLRSINAMLWPLIAGLTLAALWTWAHRLVVHTLVDERRRPLLRRLSIALGAVGGTCFVTGLLAATVGNPYTSLARELIAPLGLAAGVALLTYAGHVYGRARSQPSAAVDSIRLEPRWLRPAGLGLVAVLVTINLLWAVTYYAKALGDSDSYQLAKRGFSDQPEVVVNSTERLFLDPFGGVQETPLGGKDAAYQFRYSDLRLLIRSGGKYFLVPSGYSIYDPVVIVLNDNDTVSVQFIRT